MPGIAFCDLRVQTLPPHCKFLCNGSVSHTLADDPKNDTYSQNDGWEFVSLGDQVNSYNFFFSSLCLTSVKISYYASLGNR